MKISSKPNCPLHNFDPCKELECAWFTQIRGHNPNTGAEVDEWGCAISWMPILLIENAQMSRQTGAAVESFRNEVVKTNEASQQILIAATNKSIGVQ
jgi:hypothetical protein